MNITFLIGNGFDLNLGLKTTYSDFLKEYISVIDEKEPLKSFKKDILKDFDKWSEAEKAFGIYTKEFSGDAKDFCLCHEDFCFRLGQYLKTQESKIKFFGRDKFYATNFISSITFNNLIKGFRSKTRELLDNVQQRISSGYTYNFINFNYTNTLDQILSCVKSTQTDIGKRNTSSGLFHNHIGKSVHIHGYAEKNMVLGVNDETQITSMQLFDNCDEEYKNQLIKQKINEMNQENTDAITKSIICASHLIYIYGMSIGETDALWWKEIIESMKVKNYLHVIIHCFNGEDFGLLPTKKALYDKQKRNEFLDFAGTNSDNNISSRIHIDVSNIFSSLSVGSIIADKKES